MFLSFRCGRITRNFGSENWNGNWIVHFGKLDRSNPVIQFWVLSQPASPTHAQPAAQPAGEASGPAGHPPSHGWPAGQGWLGRWLAAWRAASQSCPAATQQAGWAAGWQACYDSQARSCSWLPDCFGWLALRGPLAGWTSQGPCHLHCSHPQCLQPKPHACDMKVGWSVLDHSLLWHASQDHHEGLCT